MKTPILVVFEKNVGLADDALRLVEAQGLLVRLTQHLREACELLSQRLDIVLLTVPAPAAAVRGALFRRHHDGPRILVVASPEGSKEGALEFLEAGAFSFMHMPDSAKSILKEMHRIRKLPEAHTGEATHALRKVG